MDRPLRDALRQTFEHQARICTDAGTPVCAAILDGAGAEIATAGGVLDSVLADWTDLAPGAAMPLRVLGAVHRRALDGQAPELAALLPTCGGTPDLARAWPAARAAIAAAPAFIRSYLARPPQTNEVRRSAALVGGFLEIAAATRRPLHLLELGASAGLNLCWDRYRIVTSEFAWGPENAPVTLRCDWDGPPPSLPESARVIARAACDRDPVDLRADEDRQRLESYIWADQVERLARLRDAAKVALAEGIRVVHADADAWLPQQITHPRPGVATVIYHSVFWSYLPAETQSRLRESILAAGARATGEAPLAWLSMETDAAHPLMPALTLTLWPGGIPRKLATVHFHGNFVRWGS